MKFFVRELLFLVFILTLVFSMEVNAQVSQNIAEDFMSDNFNVPTSDEVFLKSWISDVGIKYTEGDLVYHDGITYRVVQDFSANGDSNWINAPSLFEIYDLSANTTILESEEIFIEEELVGTTIDPAETIVSSEEDFIDVVPFMEVGDSVSINGNPLERGPLCGSYDYKGVCNVKQQVVSTTRYNYGTNQATNKKNLGVNTAFGRAVRDSFCYNQGKTFPVTVSLAYGPVSIAFAKTGSTSYSCSNVPSSIRSSYTKIHNYSDVQTKKIKNTWHHQNNTYSHTTYTTVTTVLGHKYVAQKD